MSIWNFLSFFFIFLHCFPVCLPVLYYWLCQLLYAGTQGSARLLLSSVFSLIPPLACVDSSLRLILRVITVNF